MPVKHSAHSIHSTGFGPVGVTRASFGSAPPCISVSQVLTFLRTGECGRYLKLAADGPGLRSPSAQQRSNADTFDLDPSLSQSGAEWEEEVQAGLEEDLLNGRSAIHCLNFPREDHIRVTDVLERAKAYWILNPVTLRGRMDFLVISYATMQAAGIANSSSTSPTWQQGYTTQPQHMHPRSRNSSSTLGAGLAGSPPLAGSTTHASFGVGSIPFAAAVPKGTSHPWDALTDLRVVLRVIECKASWQQQVSHMQQLAMYRMALQALLMQQGRRAPDARQRTQIECVLALKGQASANMVSAAHRLAPDHTTSSASAALRAAAGAAHSVHASTPPYSSGAGAGSTTGATCAAHASQVVDVAVAWPVVDPAVLAGHEADLYSVLGAAGPVAKALQASHVNQVPFSLGAHCSGCESKIASACLGHCAKAGVLQNAQASRQAHTACMGSMGPAVQDIEELAVPATGRPGAVLVDSNPLSISMPCHDDVQLVRAFLELTTDPTSQRVIAAACHVCVGRTELQASDVPKLLAADSTADNTLNDATTGSTSQGVVVQKQPQVFIAKGRYVTRASDWQHAAAQLQVLAPTHTFALASLPSQSPQPEAVAWLDDMEEAWLITECLQFAFKQALVAGRKLHLYVWHQAQESVLVQRCMELMYRTYSRMQAQLHAYCSTLLQLASIDAMSALMGSDPWVMPSLYREGMTTAESNPSNTKATTPTHRSPSQQPSTTSSGQATINNLAQRFAVVSLGVDVHEGPSAVSSEPAITDTAAGRPTALAHGACSRRPWDEAIAAHAERVRMLQAEKDSRHADCLSALQVRWDDVLLQGHNVTMLRRVLLLLGGRRGLPLQTAEEASGDVGSTAGGAGGGAGGSGANASSDSHGEEERMLTALRDELRRRAGVNVHDHTACWYDTPMAVCPDLILASFLHWPSTPQHGHATPFPWGNLASQFRAGIFDVMRQPMQGTNGTAGGSASTAAHPTQQRVPQAFSNVPFTYFMQYWSASFPGQARQGPAMQQQAHNAGPYADGALPGRLHALLAARVLALRWIEERMHAAGGYSPGMQSHAATHAQLRLNADLYRKQVGLRKDVTFQQQLASVEMRVGQAHGSLAASASGLLMAAVDALLLNRWSDVRSKLQAASAKPLHMLINANKALLLTDVVYTTSTKALCASILPGSNATCVLLPNARVRVVILSTGLQNVTRGSGKKHTGLGPLLAELGLSLDTLTASVKQLLSDAIECVVPANIAESLRRGSITLGIAHTAKASSSPFLAANKRAGEAGGTLAVVVESLLDWLGYRVYPALQSMQQVVKQGASGNDRCCPIRTWASLLTSQAAYAPTTSPLGTSTSSTSATIDAGNTAMFLQAAAYSEAVKQVLPGLNVKQQEAVVSGLDPRVRIQLIQGPPGTGKTTTLAASIFLRAAQLQAAWSLSFVSSAVLAEGSSANQNMTTPPPHAASSSLSRTNTQGRTGSKAIAAQDVRLNGQTHGQRGRRVVVFVAANTHTAVDQLLLALVHQWQGNLATLQAAATAAGAVAPAVAKSTTSSSSIVQALHAAMVGTAGRALVVKALSSKSGNADSEESLVDDPHAPDGPDAACSTPVGAGCRTDVNAGCSTPANADCSGPAWAGRSGAAAAGICSTPAAGLRPSVTPAAPDTAGATGSGGVSVASAAASSHGLVSYAEAAVEGMALFRYLLGLSAPRKLKGQEKVLHALERAGVVIIGGTTSALLKLQHKLRQEQLDKVKKGLAKSDAGETEGDEQQGAFSPTPFATKLPPSASKTAGNTASKAMAKGGCELSQDSGTPPSPYGFADLLVIDEASMMPAPHMVALAGSLLRVPGGMMLGGDHRQLGAILAHDFASETRPSLMLHPTMGQSAYAHVWAMGRPAPCSQRSAESTSNSTSSNTPAAVLNSQSAVSNSSSSSSGAGGCPSSWVALSQLAYSHRLPPAVCKLVRGVYARDGIALEGRRTEQPDSLPPTIPSAQQFSWQGPVLHTPDHHHHHGCGSGTAGDSLMSSMQQPLGTAQQPLQGSPLHGSQPQAARTTISETPEQAARPAGFAAWSSALRSPLPASSTSPSPYASAESSPATHTATATVSSSSNSNSSSTMAPLNNLQQPAEQGVSQQAQAETYPTFVAGKVASVGNSGWLWAPVEPSTGIRAGNGPKTFKFTSIISTHSGNDRNVMVALPRALAYAVRAAGAAHASRQADRQQLQLQPGANATATATQPGTSAAASVRNVIEPFDPAREDDTHVIFDVDTHEKWVPQATLGGAASPTEPGIAVQGAVPANVYAPLKRLVSACRMQQAFVQRDQHAGLSTTQSPSSMHLHLDCTLTVSFTLSMHRSAALNPCASKASAASSASTSCAGISSSSGASPSPGRHPGGAATGGAGLPRSIQDVPEGSLWRLRFKVRDCQLLGRAPCSLLDNVSISSLQAAAELTAPHSPLPPAVPLIHDTALLGVLRAMGVRLPAAIPAQGPPTTSSSPAPLIVPAAAAAPMPNLWGSSLGASAAAVAATAGVSGLFANVGYMAYGAYAAVAGRKSRGAPGRATLSTTAGAAVVEVEATGATAVAAPEAAMGITSVSVTTAAFASASLPSSSSVLYVGAMLGQQLPGTATAGASTRDNASTVAGSGLSRHQSSSAGVGGIDWLLPWGLSSHASNALPRAPAAQRVQCDSGLYLVLHDECGSTNINQLELQLVTALVQAEADRRHAAHLHASMHTAPSAYTSSGTHPTGSAGSHVSQPHAVVLSPHRAHCAALRTCLAHFMRPSGSGTFPAAMHQQHNSGLASTHGSLGHVQQRFVTVVDTVEKLQGQEAPIVIYSACVSDVGSLAKSSEFYTSLQRANVAFTRTQQRLIVVVSQSMLAYAPADSAQYDSMALWKELRRKCMQPVTHGSVLGQNGVPVNVQVLTCTL